MRNPAVCGVKGMDKVKERISSLKQKIQKMKQKRHTVSRAQFFRFKPFSVKQKQVLTWWMPGSPVKEYDGIIADGAIRSGKTVCMSLSFVFWAMRYRVADHRNDNLVEVRRGDTANYFYIFGGKDERSQDLIQGITLAGVFCDEVALMPESFVNQATGRCSVDGSRYPGKSGERRQEAGPEKPSVHSFYHG